MRKLVKEQLYQADESSPVDLQTQNFAASPSTTNFNQLQQDLSENQHHTQGSMFDAALRESVISESLQKPPKEESPQDVQEGKVRSVNRAVEEYEDLANVDYLAMA